MKDELVPKNWYTSAREIRQKILGPRWNRHIDIVVFMKTKKIDEVQKYWNVVSSSTME